MSVFFDTDDLVESRLTKRQQAQANSAQLRAMRVDSPLDGPPDIWEKLRRKLDDRRCASCSRSLCGHKSKAEVCGEACKKRRKRLREGAHTPERQLNQRDGRDEARWLPLIKKQIANGPKAEYTHSDLAKVDSAYAALIESSNKRRKKWHGIRPDVIDTPPHPENVAWVAAYRAGTLPASTSDDRNLAQMNHDPQRGPHDTDPVSDPHVHAS